MKGKEIIEYTVRGKMPDLEEVREKCHSQVADIISLDNKQNTQRTGKIKIILRKPAAVIALMVCFTLLVSATIIIYNQTQYIPFKGFVNGGEYEIYYTPDILKLGKNAIVETVTRVKDGKTSELSIIITDSLDKNLKIITEKHGEFDLIPAVDYNYSSFGTMGKFQFYNEGGYSSYGYYIKDFPDINEFTLVNNGESIEVKLASSNPDDVLIAGDSGVNVRFYSMSKGSKVLAYEIYENKIDFGKILGISGGYKNVELGEWANGHFKLYDENGKEIRFNGYNNSRGPGGRSETMILRIERDKKISRIAINKLQVSIGFQWNNSDVVDIPVPKDGEEIILDDGLLLYDRNGLTSKLKSVIRKGNGILIYTETEYNGEDIGDIEYMGICFYGGLGNTMIGWGFDGIAINGDEDFITIRPDTVRFFLKGNWEIKFAD